MQAETAYRQGDPIASQDFSSNTSLYLKANYLFLRILLLRSIAPLAPITGFELGFLDFGF